MFLEVFIQMLPYLAVFAVLRYIGQIQQKKAEERGDEITWRSTFGKKRTFRFEDITYCEWKGNSLRVYVNGKKLVTIDSGIDDREFMDDIERRKIPVKFYSGNQEKKKRW